MNRPADAWEGRTAAELRSRWGVPEVHLYESVGSTNDVARRLASTGASAGSVVVAERQIAGRGRAGRHWDSPPRMGLWLSVLAPAGIPAVEGLPLRVGLCAARALDPFVGRSNVTVKWPNDLLVGDRKVGGILCEASWEGEVRSAVVVGLGLNVSQSADDFPPEIRGLACSVAMLADASPSRLRIADALVREIRRVVVDAPAQRAAAEEIERRDALRGRRVAVTEPGSGRIVAAGLVLGISPDGLLLLRTDAGVVCPVRSGSVRITHDDRSGARPLPENRE